MKKILKLLILFLSLFELSFASNISILEKNINENAKSFIEKTDLAIFYYTLSNVSNELSNEINANEKLNNIISNNLKSEKINNMEMFNKDFFYRQSILDNLYFGKRIGKKIPEKFKDLNWNITNVDDDKGNIILNYIFKRILNDLKYRKINIKNMEKNIEIELKNKPFYYGYFLTHIILYDSEFFSKNINISPYYKIIKELENLVDYVIKNKEYDLGYELYMCLSYFQLFENKEYKKLEKFLFKKNVFKDTILKGDTHLKVVYGISYAMKYEYTPKEKGFIESINGKIYYEVYGSKSKEEPLILISGGPGWSHEILYPLLNLSRKRQVILYDQIGTGKSNKVLTIENLSINDYIIDLSNIIQNLGLEKVSILGHSWGTMVAIDYTLKYPKKVSKLILASPVISASDWARDTKIKYNTLKSSDKDDEYTEKYLLKDLYKYMDYFIDFNENIYLKLWGESEYNINGWSKVYEKKEELNKIDKKVLITAGEFDEIYPETIKDWNNYLENSKYIIFKNTRHVHYIEDRVNFINEVNNFLKEEN
ncbi:proline-specific peptidase [Hypnocyclicus thermotrophus]|uniref:Proline-specific peptidase n=1 Tax=Hypnocyclicus thermotrophus TaxID=1627895 RepID=A0AA46DXJ5_9FUSO|nr:alpha/beta fold hydrolase [Hypnocyclicus thermotrophus]TDT68525.1 proline-specific peptidase [Hypnocyclicus thermotrophus]